MAVLVSVVGGGLNPAAGETRSVTTETPLAGEARPAAIEDPRFRIALDALLGRRPAEAVPYLTACLADRPPDDAAARRPILLLLALAHHQLREHAAFHAAAEALADADDSWGRLARLLLLVDHLNRGDLPHALRFAAGNGPGGDLLSLHHLAAAMALAAAGEFDGAAGRLPPALEDPELTTPARRLEAWLAAPGALAPTEAALTDTLRAAEAALRQGSAELAAARFAAAFEEATSLGHRLDPQERVRALSVIEPEAMAAALHPLSDRSAGTTPYFFIDDQVLEARLMARILDLLGASPQAAAARPILTAGSAETRSSSEPAAPAPLDATESGRIAARLEVLRLALGELAAARRAEVERRTRADLIAAHRARLEALRAACAADLHAATLDLDRAHERAAAAGDQLDIAVALATGRAEAHVDSIVAVGERLRAAARGLTALFPPPEAAEHPELPFFGVHRTTVGHDHENLAGIAESLARARAALPRSVAVHVRGERWPAVTRALAAADSLARRSAAIAGPLASDPELLALLGQSGDGAENDASAQRSIIDNLEMQTRRAAEELVATMAEADRAAAARAGARLAHLAEAARFGHAEALLRVARRFGPIAPETATTPDEPSPAEEALRRAAAGFEAFLASEPQGPGVPAAWLRLGELRQELAELDFRRAIATYVAAERSGNASGPLPVRDTARPTAAAAAFLARFPSHPGADRALYNLAVLAHEDGDRAASTAYFARLRREWPRSPLAPEAALRIGDNHFEAQEFAEAEAAYDLIAGDPGRLGTAGLYKLGWCRLNRSDPAGAAQAFGGLLDRDLDSAIREDGEITLARCLADLGGADAAEPFFASRPPAPYGPAVFRHLAQELARRADYPEAARAARAGATRYAGDRALPGLLEVEIEILDQADRPAEAAGARLDFARRIGPGSPWFNRHGSDSLAVAAAAVMLRGADQLLVFAQGRQTAGAAAAEGWAAARDAYHQYLQRFPGFEAADRAEFLLAECEMNLGRPVAAAAAYAQAAATTRDTTRARQAAYGAVVAWAQARGPAAANPTHLDQELKAIDGFVNRFGPDPRTPDILMRRGAICFAAGRYDEAGASYARLVTMHPESPHTLRGMRLQGDAELKGGRPALAAETYARLLGDPRLASDRGDAQGLGSGFLAETTNLLQVARFQAAAELAEAGKPAAAATAFMNLAASAPDFAQADLALLRAAEAYRQAGAPREAAAACRQLADTYPRSANRAPALLRLATLCGEAGQPAAAAREYLRFAVDYPDSSGAPAALVEARLLALKSGDWSLVESAARAYLARDKVEAPETLAARVDLAEALAATDRPELAIQEFDRALAGQSGAGVAHAHLRRAQLRLPGYRKLALAPPILPAIERKKELLSTLLADFDQAIRHGSEEDAATAGELFGACLADFGQALEESQPPSDLAGEDLITYSQTLAGEADAFYRRAETVWRQAVERAAGQGVRSPAVDEARRQLFARYDRRYPELARAFLSGPATEGQGHALKKPEVKNAAPSRVAAAR